MESNPSTPPAPAHLHLLLLDQFDRIIMVGEEYDDYGAGGDWEW